MQYTKSNVCNITESRQEELLEHYEGCICETESCQLTSGCCCIDRFGPAYNTQGRLQHITPYGDCLTPVVECNNNCTCEKSCINRVVQHGVTVNLQVFDVGLRGVGMRSLQPIARGSFVCEYAGELLSHRSARKRAATYKDPAKHNYILAVREFFGAKLLTTYVDATCVGNVGRFINHSCDPNLFVQPVRVENAVPHVALFALRDIPVFTELTYDYSGGNSTADCSLTLPVDTNETNSFRKHCLCGSSQCREILPYDDTLFTS